MEERSHTLSPPLFFRQIWMGRSRLAWLFSPMSLSIFPGHRTGSAFDLLQPIRHILAMTSGRLICRITVYAQWFRIFPPPPGRGQEDGHQTGNTFFTRRLTMVYETFMRFAKRTTYFGGLARNQYKSPMDPLLSTSLFRARTANICSRSEINNVGNSFATIR